MIKKNRKEVLDEVDVYLDKVSSHFGLNTEYAKKVAKKTTKHLEEPRTVLFVNSFLNNNRRFIESSMASVINLEDINVKKGLVNSEKTIKEMAIWVKNNSREKNYIAVYAVDEELIDSLTYKTDNKLYRIKDIFREKAVEYSEAFLQEIQEIFQKEGVNLNFKILVGNPLEELHNELGEDDSLAVGNNEMAKMVDTYFVNRIIKLNGKIEFTQVKGISERNHSGKGIIEKKIEKLNRYMSKNMKLRDALAEDGGKKKK